MPAPSPFPPSQPSQPFPALYLYPINDSFVPKHIALLNNQHIKIGRQTNAKTAPGERNGFFDSKVLSRQHAEVWEEGGKIYIKDVKSSNGTFINGERLSPEGVESEQFELKSDDIVEFGIDIVGEDNKTIIHHKVAARVVCVFNEQDVQIAARAEQHQQQQQQQYHPQGTSSLHGGQPGGGANGSAGTFNFAGAQQQRRTQLAQQGLTGMGGMGGNIRPPGKSGLSFELIFSRLQGELQKSKDTGAELQNLTSALGEIQDTLGGALPQNMPPPPHNLPPVRPSQPPPAMGESSSAVVANTAPEAPTQSPPVISSETLLEIQTRLQDTQSSLASHVDKIRALESILAEQEALKREMRVLRDMMESREREMILAAAQRAQEADREKDEHSARKPRSNFDDDDDDDDDARSVATVTAGELERVDEEDEDRIERGSQDHLDESEIQDPDLETDEEKHRRREELGRPRTPEPTMGMHAAILNGQPSHRSLSPSQKEKIVPSHPDMKEMSDQVSALSEQVRAVLAVKSTLEAQHVTAQATIQTLEKKVEALEAMVKTSQEQQTAATQVSPPSPPPSVATTSDEAKESLTEILSEWKKSVQGQWSFVQEEWSQERERLNRAREEFEAKTHQVDAGLEKLTSLESTMNAVQQTQMTQGQQVTTLQTWMNRMQESSTWFRQHVNGEAVRHGLSSGLVTPPSPPRSRSSDSGRYNRRRRRRSSSTGRRPNAGESSSEESSPESSPVRESRSPSREIKREGEGLDTDTDATFPSDDNHPHTEKLVALLKKRVGLKEEEEDGDVRMLTLTGGAKEYIVSSSADAEEGEEGETELRKRGVDARSVSYVNVQAAIGVLVLSVAAAAVIWRVKPE
ncbi:hypothetical protein AX15_005534 [Amanita polypyramis BW_CC]|nr:hypothetical protein AX15_005534 [Amanita polypyramis BW_CC]